VPNQLKVRPAEQVSNVRLATGEEVVQTNHLVTFGKEAIAKVRSKKSGTAGDKNAHRRNEFLPDRQLSEKFKLNEPISRFELDSTCQPSQPAAL
jgi:hypothetical protein